MYDIIHVMQKQEVLVYAMPGESPDVHRQDHLHFKKQLGCRKREVSEQESAVKERKLKNELPQEKQDQW